VLCNASVGHGMHPVKAVHVELDSRARQPEINQMFPITSTTPDIEFDASRGIYLLTVSEPKSTCGAAEFVDVIPGGNRSIDLTMKPHGAQRPRTPPTLFSGTTPLGFNYAAPTVVLLQGPLQCNQSIGNPITMNSFTENDDDSYYVSIFSYESAVGVKPLTALRLTDNSGGYHYVRMTIPLSSAYQAWPNEARFDVDQDMIDYVVDKPEDTYLCPHLYRTSVGG